MTTALLGAELGAGLGHAAVLAWACDHLAGRGINSVVALPDLALVSVFPAFETARCVAAPCGHVPLRFRRSLIGRPKPGSAGIADVLALRGYGEPEDCASLVRGWRSLIDLVRPDVVISDFAPGLNLAARDRLPVIALGHGYSLPPDIEPAPRFDPGRPPVMSDRDLLDAMNGALPTGGSRPLARVTEAFRGDESVLRCFPLFDPYQVWRPGAGLGPLERQREAADAGDGVFAYLSLTADDVEDVIFGLVASGADLRIFVPKAPKSLLAYLREAGARVDLTPPDIGAAVRDAALVVHHGGLGVAQAAAEIGRRQLILPTDWEKDFIAGQLTGTGAARRVTLKRDPIRQTEAATREMLADRTAALAAEELGRALRSFEGDAAGAFEAALARTGAITA